MVGMRSSYPGRWLVTLGFVAWVASVLYVVACLAAPSVLGGVGCELSPGNSVLGEASRSWIPPGTTCTYNLGVYGRYVSRPAPVRLVVVAAALAGLPLLRYLGRVLKRSTPVDA